MTEIIKDGDEISPEEAVSSEESQDTDLDETESTEEEENVESESEEDSAADDGFHKTELEKVKERLGKKVDKERERRIAAERNRGLSREEAEVMVNEKVSEVVKGLQRSTIEDRVDQLARTPEEKELILYHYDRSIVPTGNLNEDLENAYALANKNKVRTQISELKKSILSKKTRQSGSDAGAEIKPKPSLKISKEDRELAKFAGVAPEKFVEQKEKNK